VIENVLREKNLPDDLKYIAVIESALLPRAQSNQGAAGMWQFMKGTAELFGLKVGKVIDERKDVIKSTEKATDYLQLLYETYGNWTIALAAYNCGTGRVNKAIKKAGGSKDYWAVSQYLPTETKRYIPRFIAAAYLMNYYYIHDLSPALISDDIRYTSTVKVFDKIDLKKLSNELDLDFEIMKYLNPVFVKDYIPAAEEGEFYTLTLPDYKMSVYVDKFNILDNLVINPVSQKRYSEADQAVTSETRSSKEYIKFLSNHFSIVRDNLKDSSLLGKLSKGILPGRERMKLYQLGKKESLADVAEAKNIPLADLISINNIDESKGLPPGSIIILSR
jgi:membrane-bound lytic murein transglycosylase D